jgi:L-alanine-DL-glutamate epimerase-like enolase superfamily enzyme
VTAAHEPTVEALDAGLYRARLPRPWGDGVDHSYLIRTEITTSDGRSGHGWTWLPDVGSAAAHRLVSDDCRAHVQGGPTHPAAVWDGLWAHLHEAGSGGLTTVAMAAVDTALWDLHLHALGTTLPALLGPRRTAVRAYGSGVNYHYGLDELVAQAERWIAAGYGAVKIKVGHPEVAEDVRRAAAVREVIGPDRLLMLDANQRWDLPAAIGAIEALAFVRPAWVEEPLRSDDTAGYVALRAATGVPIAVGENHHTIYQYRELLTRGACDIVQPNVARVGGITPFLRIARLAEDFGVPVYPHHLPELSAQLAMALGAEPWVEVVEDASLTALGALAGPGCAVVDGPGYRLRPGGEAGLGLEIATGTLERLDSQQQGLTKSKHRYTTDV